MKGVLLILSIVALGTRIEAFCQNGWTRFEGSCYFFADLQKMNWTDAYNYCWNMDAHLVTIETKAENDFIKHELLKLHPATEDQFWTNGNDRDAEGTWVWGQTTDPIVDTYWHVGEPNQNGGEEDCLAFYTRYHFDWNDEHCNRNMNFICEIEDGNPGSGIIG